MIFIQLTLLENDPRRKPCYFVLIKKMFKNKIITKIQLKPCQQKKSAILKFLDI